MHVGIVGTGRLGSSLALLFRRHGLTVDARGRGAGIPDGEVLLLTVPDGQLAAVAQTIPEGRILLHCAGARDIDVLRPYAPAGSWHPLMTFPGPAVAIPELSGVPVALAGDPQAIEAGEALAKRLDMVPFVVPGDRRLYHAAAVIAGNFASLLLAEAATVLTAAGVPPERAPALLAPLALQSLRNTSQQPSAAFTGPAARGDVATLAAHRAALTDAGLLATLHLYDALTERLIARVADISATPREG